ncbi:MAG TPA: hypothetical protein VK644_00365 [Chitinophagaceae bacterium]|nr:hypothetical protein [Chitinophagaceae bacterium]
MRFSLLLLLILATSISAPAQKKLKHSIDKNTGDTTFYTGEDRLYTQAGATKSIGEILKSSVYKSRNGFMLSLFIQTGRTSVFSLEQGDPAELRLEDGTIIPLRNLTDNSSRVSSMGYGCFSYAYYRLLSDDVERLKSSPVTFIRIHTSGGNMDYSLKEKFGDVIGEQLGKF